MVIGGDFPHTNRWHTLRILIVHYVSEHLLRCLLYLNGYSVGPSLRWWHTV